VDSEPLVVAVRSVIAFVSLLIFARLLGKQQIGQLTYFEYITGITIGSIAARLSTSTSFSPISQWVGLATWVVIPLSLQILSLRVRWWSKVIQGEPTVVVHNGKLLENNMHKLRFPFSDLMERLREKGAFNIADVEFAVLEPDGNLSVLKKSQARPVTPRDLGRPTPYEGMSTEVVFNGQILDQNLKQTNLNRQWLIRELAKQKITRLDQVAYASVDSQGKLYVDRYDDDLVVANDPSDYQGPN